MLDTKTKILLLIFAGAILVVLLFNNRKSPSPEMFQHEPDNYNLPMDMEMDDYDDMTSNNYKRISYSDETRGQNELSDWDNYFDQNNNIIGNSQFDGTRNFSPVEETSKEFAPYQSAGDRRDLSPDELFNADNYLPQEKNDEWFKTIDEPISVKNRHLINVTRPFGVNTQASSNRNASHDLRAVPPAPKTVVSPWNNSTMEPDTNIKSFG